MGSTEPLTSHSAAAACSLARPLPFYPDMAHSLARPCDAFPFPLPGETPLTLSVHFKCCLPMKAFPVCSSLTFSPLDSWIHCLDNFFWHQSI